ncbi:hypothetical protein JXI42_11170, partial [bacterium]|nr:hypothetical protein [bacterium]
MKTKVIFWLIILTGVCIAQPTIEWQKSLGGYFGDYAQAIQQTSDGGFIVAGRSYSTDGDITDHHGSNDSCDYWIVKLSPDPVGITENDLPNNFDLNIYPNP